MIAKSLHAITTEGLQVPLYSITCGYIEKVIKLKLLVQPIVIVDVTLEMQKPPFGGLGNGRGQSKLVEQAELSVKREYLVLWKKQTVDPNKLAKLYWDQGLNRPY